MSSFRYTNHHGKTEWVMSEETTRDICEAMVKVSSNMSHMFENVQTMNTDWSRCPYLNRKLTGQRSWFSSPVQPRESGNLFQKPEWHRNDFQHFPFPTRNGQQESGTTFPCSTPFNSPRESDTVTQEETSNDSTPATIFDSFQAMSPMIQSLITVTLSRLPETSFENNHELFQIFVDAGLIQEDAPRTPTTISNVFQSMFQNSTWFQHIPVFFRLMDLLQSQQTSSNESGQTTSPGEETTAEDEVVNVPSQESKPEMDTPPVEPTD